ncbi:hypothetical protein GO014_09425 [Devosia sp. L53-10-65]|uniref:Uncharacterized protein n=2 Tax=Devosia marina TaxID=2683198 RepID=A0A7X3FSU2_9HYPH|nr:hypothetical protein [Devosia marina]
MQIYNAHGAIQNLRQDWHGDLDSALGHHGTTARLAWDSLRAKFRAGRIKTFAQLVNEPAKGVGDIDAANWQGLFLMPPTGVLVDALCYADKQPVYFNVSVEKASLFAEYPPDGERAPTAAMTESSAEAKRPAKGHAAGIEAAIAALWPDGLPAGLPVAERNDIIFREMQRQGTTTKATIDPVTFRRFFKERSSR